MSSRIKHMYRAWQHNCPNGDSWSAFEFAWRHQKEKVHEQGETILELKARIAELEGQASDMRMLLAAKDERMARLEARAVTDEQIADIVSEEMGACNGWHFETEGYCELCMNTAKRIRAALQEGEKA